MSSVNTNIGAGSVQYCDQLKRRGQLGCCGVCRGCINPQPAGTKLWHQGLVMSGCGAPPGTCEYDTLQQCGTSALRDVQVPTTRTCMPLREDGTGAFINPNFLYDNWIDSDSNTWYVLERNPLGYPLGYRIQATGTADVLTAALYSKRLNVPSNSDAVNNGTTFVFGNPPTPARIATIVPAQGYTLTPDYVLVGADYAFQVFVRDKRTNRYVRDTYNSRCTEPVFPTNPCNGDQFVQTLTNGNRMLYIWDNTTCSWYLDDDAPAGTPLASPGPALSPSASLRGLRAFDAAASPSPSTGTNSDIASQSDAFIPPVPTSELTPLRNLWDRCGNRGALNPSCV